MTIFEMPVIPNDPLPKETFWMVYGIGQAAPTCRHPTMEAAAAEAKRLARAHRGTAFVVLKAIGAVFCDDLRTVSFHEPKSEPNVNEDIPF